MILGANTSPHAFKNSLFCTIITHDKTHNDNKFGGDDKKALSCASWQKLTLKIYLQVQ